MADTKETKEVTIAPVADFTLKDLQEIEKFKEEGMLGLARITDIDVERSMALYMDGKSYRQIASVLKIKKNLIMFIAHKFKWYELRKDYLEELHATLKDKVVESKLQSQEFLLELVLAYQKRVSRNIHEYLRTDDANFFDKIDSKDINTVLKVMELLHKFSSENAGLTNDKSLVSLNGMGDGVTIKKTGSNSVEITPKSPFSNKLKAFADFKREEEKANQPQKEIRDITVEKEIPTQEREDKK